MKRNTLITLTLLTGVVVFVSVVALVEIYLGGSVVVPVQKVQLEKQAPDQVQSFMPSEVFSGTINGKALVFEHQDFTQYRLTVDGLVTVGDLNTERGFGEDIDATVFVLDYKKPEAEQSYFVRLTGDNNHVKPLDHNRRIVPGVLLKSLVKSAEQVQESIIGGSRDVHGTEPSKPVACTMDAKECPDGSYVGRSGPNCEFVCSK